MVTTATKVNVSAAIYGLQETDTITVKPVTIKSVTLNPTTVTGGSTSTGTVHLSAQATSPTTVGLSSSNTSAATVPASVTLAKGALSGTFTVKTVAVAAATSVSIHATLGAVVKSATLTVDP